MTTSPDRTDSRPPRAAWYLFALGLVALVVVVPVVLVTIPVTRGLLAAFGISSLIGGHVENLAVDLEIAPGLRWIFALLVMLPIGIGARRLVNREQGFQGLGGLALIMGVLSALLLVGWLSTYNFAFDRNGQPMVYLSLRRDGAYKSFTAGVDRVTGKPKMLVTVQRAAWLSDLVRQPVQELDPAICTNWFDANSGDPNLWFLETGPGEFHFYNRPHFHRQLAIEVEPITPAVMQQWSRVRAEHLAREAAEQARLRAEEEAVRLRRAAEDAKRRADEDAAARRREVEDARKREAARVEDAIARQARERADAMELAVREAANRRAAEVADQAERERLATVRREADLAAKAERERLARANRQSTPEKRNRPEARSFFGRLPMLPTGRIAIQILPPTIEPPSAPRVSAPQVIGPDGYGSTSGTSQYRGPASNRYSY